MAIFLDNNATTPVDPAVLDAMLPFFSERFGNPSSKHAYGQDVAGPVRQARQQVKALIGAAQDSEIVFTSGGTESDNTAIISALEADPGRNEIVISAVEHPAILSTVGWLENRRGVTVHRIGVDAAGRFDESAYAAALGLRTAIASVMWANNETGTVFPIARLAALAKAAGALFHTDAVQAAGRLPTNVVESDVDMLSLSSHKFHGPKGVGALYVRKGVRFSPLIRGGRQERGRRAGTENTPGIVGMGAAAELASRRYAEAVRIGELRDRLQADLASRIEETLVLGDVANRLPNTLAIAFACLDSEAVLAKLEQEGVAASSGSACASGSMEPSHVLRAMNTPADYLQGAVRFSLSRDTTQEEIDRVAVLLPDIVARLRAMSPLWQDRRARKFA